uniref:Uncharacterized protein n=1 Tax=Helianthus annuus TaxID=4232 RepID=A0A251S0C6_HELAN
MPSVIAPASTASPSLHTASSVLSTRFMCFLSFHLLFLLRSLSSMFSLVLNVAFQACLLCERLDTKTVKWTV